MSSQVRVFAGSLIKGLGWSLHKHVVYGRDVYGPSATERPFGTVREEKEIYSQFQVSISLRYDLNNV